MPVRVSAPYSVMTIGLPSDAQPFELLGPGELGAGEVAGVDVPAVVAVEHQDVGEL